MSKSAVSFGILFVTFFKERCYTHLGTCIVELIKHIYRAKISVCELGLEYGVWGMEFNFKLGVYKQEWHYQACLVFNPNPNVYY